MSNPEEDILTITDTTVQLILCSQIFKKVKTALTEQLLQDDTLTETDTVLELLKFMLLVMRRASPRIQVEFSPLDEYYKEQPHQAELYKLV